MLALKLINIGFGNLVSSDKIIAVVSPDSAPIKRMVQDAKEQGMLIDATYGRKTRSVIISESEHIILSAINPESIGNRSEVQEAEDNG